MTLQIMLPDPLAIQLQQQAQREQRSLEALVIVYLQQALAQSSEAERLEDDPAAQAWLAQSTSAVTPPTKQPAAEGLANLLRQLDQQEAPLSAAAAEAETNAFAAAEAELRALDRRPMSC